MGFLSGFLKGKKGKQSGLPRTSPAVAERIKAILGLRELEPMPVQAARAFQLASDPFAKLSQFVSVIESDEALSARIIRIANSVYFFRGTPAAEIEKAVANIGLDELRCLLSAAMLRSLLQSRHKAREQIWANSVATGLCSRQLSGRTKKISSGEAFLCGLLHDVGKLIMIRKGAQLYDKVMDLVGSGSRSFVEAEEEVFELNHVEVGKWVGEMWNFPEPVIAAIAEHHHPWPGVPPADISHGLLVKCADAIAHGGGIGHAVTMRSYMKRCEEEAGRAFDVLGITAGDRTNYIAYLQAQFEKESSMYQFENR